METSNEPVIEVIRIDNRLSSVKVIMPTWNDLGEDNKIYIKMPLIGGLVTYALDENDADVAVREAIEGFCIACEKFGNGLEKELESIGWIVASSKEGRTILNIHSDNAIFELVLETGETRAICLEIENELELA